MGIISPFSFFAIVTLIGKNCQGLIRIKSACKMPAKNVVLTRFDDKMLTGFK